MIRALLVYLTLAALAWGDVVRSAPNVAWDGPSGANSLRGQPVVLLMAKSGRAGAFRKQVRNLEEIYQQFASRQVVFVAALLDDGEAASNIPFTLARDPAKVAADYGVEDRFAIIIIGKDGNIDLQTSEVIPASRVRDVINNSFEMQAAARKGQ